MSLEGLDLPCERGCVFSILLHLKSQRSFSVVISLCSPDRLFHCSVPYQDCNSGGSFKVSVSLCSPFVGHCDGASMLLGEMVVNSSAKHLSFSSIFINYEMRTTISHQYSTIIYYTGLGQVHKLSLGKYLVTLKML